MRLAMRALTLTLEPTDHGRPVALTDGRELVHLTGLSARGRALRRLAGRELIREITRVGFGHQR
jgi:hypothetical protein